MVTVRRQRLRKCRPGILLCWIFAQRQKTAFETETLVRVGGSLVAAVIFLVSTNIGQELGGTSAHWAKSFHGNWKKEVR